MSSASCQSAPSTKAQKEMQDILGRIQNPDYAEKLWERHLTPQDRERLGGDLNAAYFDYGTVGMWAWLRSMPAGQAAIEIYDRFAPMPKADYEWLLREFGVEPDADIARERAIESGALVLVENPREAYWKAEKIEVAWNRHDVLWDYFWQLARFGKSRRRIDSLVFGDPRSQDPVTKWKSRLTTKPEFPVELGDRITALGRGEQQLELPPEQIRIFERVSLEDLREWHP